MLQRNQAETESAGVNKMKICLFIGDMYRDFALSIIENVDRYARQGRRVDVFGMCSVSSSNPLHVNGMKSILSLPDVHDYDGVIICYDTLIHEQIGADLVEDLLADMEAPPVVSIRASIPGFYNIIPDNRDLMYKVAKHVISKCKTGDIGFVTGMDELEDSYERREGFEKAMKEAGYTVSEDKIFHGDYWIRLGRQMADFYIKEDGTLPEAIICSNDYEAISLSNELIQRGYRIPEDTMVSGVDNTVESAEHVPSITTTEISNETLVDTAIKIIEDVIAGNKPELNTYIPGNLILRESTGDLQVVRDVYRALCLQNVASSVTMDDGRDFVVINGLFEGALTKEELIKVTLDRFRNIESVGSIYLVRYAEDCRLLVGYYSDKGEDKIGDVKFPTDKLLPDGMENDDKGTRIHLPITYKNEAYGYALLVVDTDIQNFINFKIEYILTQVAQNINKLELYSKLSGVADIMTLYIQDPLTGINNRRGFEKRISEMFDDEGKRLKDIAIVSIDMDELKYINDTFGHNVGDEAIKETANCINSALKSGEFVARMGGDEFAVVLIITDSVRLGKFIRDVRNNIREINKTGKYPFELSSSIGTCEVTDWHGLTDAMKKADKAMYLEKKAKKKNR